MFGFTDSWYCEKSAVGIRALRVDVSTHPVNLRSGNITIGIKRNAEHTSASPRNFLRRAQGVAWGFNRNHITCGVLSAREGRKSPTGSSITQTCGGYTLLLKGLEAEVAVVLNTEGMSPQHLYVAMTRGLMKLVVCSPNPILG